MSPFQVWRETRGGGGRARHWVNVYGLQLLDWAGHGSPTSTDATAEDEAAWAVWMDVEFSPLMIFHWTHFLRHSDLPMGDSDPSEAVMSRAELLAVAQSHRAQMEIAVSF